MRISRDEYFMRIAELTAERGTCNRAKVGAIAVKDKRIIMSGYNGSPSGVEHCEDKHYMHNGHCIATVHAEQNIIANAAKRGISLEGSTIYVTHQPCFYCMKMMISAGIKKVVYLNDYYDRLTPDFYFKLIEVEKYDELKELHKQLYNSKEIPEIYGRAPFKLICKCGKEKYSNLDLYSKEAHIEVRCNYCEVCKNG